MWERTQWWRQFPDTNQIIISNKKATLGSGHYKLAANRYYCHQDPCNPGDLQVQYAVVNIPSSEIC